jgi:translation initiation factor IF-1
MNKSNSLFLECDGKVVQKLSDGYFKIEMSKGPTNLITASIANRLKSTNRKWKRITEGDKVRIEIPLGDFTKGRIVELLD